jgi:hypothetical protein
LTPRYWRTAYGDRIDDGDDVDIVPLVQEARPAKIVLTAWTVDSARVVERGPIVGWLWSRDDQQPLPVTVMLGHEGDEHLWWAVLLLDERVTAPRRGVAWSLRCRSSTADCRSCRHLAGTSPPFGGPLE